MLTPCPACGVTAPPQTAIRAQGLVKLCPNVTCRAILGSAGDDETASPRPVNESGEAMPRAARARPALPSGDDGGDVSFADLPERRNPTAFIPAKKSCAPTTAPSTGSSGPPPLDVLRAARLRVRWLRAELRSKAGLEKELRSLERLLKAAKSEPSGKVVPLRRGAAS